jgi:glycosyltransferase involved in cell wall biosynthesis
MRICFVSTGKTWGGGERLLAWLVAGIARAQQEVALVARQGSPLAQWGQARTDISLLKLPGRARSPRSLWRLRQWLAANRFDVVVLNDPHAITSGGIAALGLDANCIGIRHTVFPIRSAWKHHRLLDRVICVSAAAQQECIAAGIPEEQTFVIHGGVPSLQIDLEHVEQVRQLYCRGDSTGKEQHLLALGSLLPVKGFDTLIRAVARGQALGRNWRLWIAGDGPERSNLESLARELDVADQVQFLGFRDDIGELLAAADMFVNASHSEGLSLVLVEAMLAQCPIASTVVGGSREVLNVGSNGLSPFAETFGPGDVDSAVIAIEQSLSEAASNQSRLDHAREWALRNFSIEQMVCAHQNFYRDLLTHNGRSRHEARGRAA